MRRSVTSGCRRTGLTLIEVLVALALLGIISAAIIASFSLVARLNRDASIDVDYSRVVRSVMERVKIVWLNTDRWEAGDGFIDDEQTTVDGFVRSLNGDCGANLLDPLDDSQVVRVLRITCGGGDAAAREQVFDLEFGKP